MWTLFFDIFCPLYIALLDMDDARGTFVTFKKLFNSCRHELEEWWSMMDILAKILKLNVLMRKKCLLSIVPTSFFFIWGHTNIKIVIFYTEVVVFLFDEWNDWKNSQFNFSITLLMFFFLFQVHTLHLPTTLIEYFVLLKYFWVLLKTWEHNGAIFYQFWTSSHWRKHFGFFGPWRSYDM